MANDKVFSARADEETIERLNELAEQTGMKKTEVLPALLNALMAPGVDKTLRDGARHVLADNSSAQVRQLSVPLVKALKGPEADLATMQEAQKLLASFR